MGPFAYYSPLLIGILLVLSMSGTIREAFPTYSDGAWYATLAAYAIAAGVLCQAVMIGLQGVYAQVLPVPVGRSIRGGAAVASGAMILIGALSFGAWALLFSEWMILGAGIAIIVGIASLLGAGLVYIWNLPAAVRDFADER